MYNGHGRKWTCSHKLCWASIFPTTFCPLSRVVSALHDCIGRTVGHSCCPKYASSVWPLVTVDGIPRPLLSLLIFPSSRCFFFSFWPTWDHRKNQNVTPTFWRIFSQTFTEFLGMLTAYGFSIFTFLIILIFHFANIFYQVKFWKSTPAIVRISYPAKILTEVPYNDSVKVLF